MAVILAHVQRKRLSKPGKNKMAKKQINSFFKKQRKKRPGRHSKNKSLSQRKKKYIGQGRN
jgi:hypothetical protein